MDESQFDQSVDDTLLAIEDALENAIDEQDLDIDYETSGGILTITFADGSKIIINRQAPLRQLWIAAKCGGYHLNWQDDGWVEEHSQSDLWPLLSRFCSNQSGASVQLQPQ